MRKNADLNDGTHVMIQIYTSYKNFYICYMNRSIHAKELHLFSPNKLRAFSTIVPMYRAYNDCKFLSVDVHDLVKRD